ncbi:hypothetical protein [Streptomyces sp. NPDC092952]|uniref:hypothetical protein n=1 Tax=Streptomyces sp. NPDC092952 TaxID=3366018 RepID=UPI0037FBD915
MKNHTYSLGPAAGIGSWTEASEIDGHPVPAVFAAPPEPALGVLVHSRRDREVAATTWLVLAASHSEKARREWSSFGLALLRCGVLFSAVRIPATLIYAAAGTEEPDAVRGFLAEVLDGGPVFHDVGGRQFYALTPASTPRSWRFVAAECLDSDTFLGVPATDLTEFAPQYPAYWVVPMDGPGSLCAPADVARLVLIGYRAAQKNAEVAR